MTEAVGRVTKKLIYLLWGNVDFISTTTDVFFFAEVK